jgi:hypothetical protein
MAKPDPTAIAENVMNPGKLPIVILITAPVTPMVKKAPNTIFISIMTPPVLDSPIFVIGIRTAFPNPAIDRTTFAENLGELRKVHPVSQAVLLACFSWKYHYLTALLDFRFASFSRL